MEEKKKFYQQKWFMWVTLFIITPVGIICLWKYKHYKTVPAVIFTLIFSLMFLSFLTTKDKKAETPTSNPSIIAKSEDKQNTSNTTKNAKSTVITKPTEKPKTIEISKPTEKPKTIEISKPTEVPKPSVPAEYKSALIKAYTYANTMNMSKKGIYNQLVSEYGEKFSAAAAQYAIDNIETDWNAHALAKAKVYQNTMNMSPSAIHNQLTSDYGEKFTQTEADYALQHLND